MDKDLKEQVMLERVEMLARLASEEVCRDQDRVIALSLIAELARGNMLKNNKFSVIFSINPQSVVDNCR